jgi:hypothetical protein
LGSEVTPETSLDWVRDASAILTSPSPLTVFKVGDMSDNNSPLTLKSVEKFPFTNPAIGA